MSIWRYIFGSSIVQRTMPDLRPLLSITGTTGTGKSQLAVQIARRFNGEIINADALQLYEGLPIATNKVSVAEMQGVKHHLLGCVGIDEEAWTIGRFVSEAQLIVSDIQSRGKLPVVVGGTHYYVQALLLENNMLTPIDTGADDLEKEQSWPILDAPSETMIEKLRELDPEAAEWWHPRDQRKIRRSLEICLNTGRKVSDLYREQQNAQAAQGPTHREKYNSLCLHLHAEQEALLQRLDVRVDTMMQGGLLEEVRFMRAELSNLIRGGREVDESRGIWSAIGFKQFASYFEALESNADAEVAEQARKQGLERTKISTRQYASRQHKWVRSKLVPGITEAGCRDRFFVLDSTDPAKWDELVSGPSFSVVSKFLQQSTLPSPEAVSDAAGMFAQNHRAVRVKHYCDLCQTTTTTADFWQKHLNSKKHKSMVRRKNNEEQYSSL